MTTLLQDYEAAIRRATSRVLDLEAKAEEWGWKFTQREADDLAYWRAELAELKTRAEKMRD